ncbi:phosphonopyruvate decarboxylase [Lonsdalea quercina]|uniref:phosphonopyruvate decarboxylase n=1 Tax=Lonsdalea quercina TaxID=71657 RepID=UPI00397563CE
MINPDDFLGFLHHKGIRFYSGVPDSLLKEFCLAIDGTKEDIRHQLACNEGTAAGMAIGYHLATNSIPVVYLQNSGLGNIVNPICSLAATDVYSIPMLFIIGWRGETKPDGTQLNDEPQHVMQGRVTLPQLDVINIPYHILEGEPDIDFPQIEQLLEQAQREKRPVALVVRKHTFSPCQQARQPARTSATLLREEIVAEVLSTLPADVPIISTTGMLSRELFKLREQRGEEHERDFLTVGGMGLASQIALGISEGRPGKKVVCLDGDGATLMHMGGLTNSALSPTLIHIVINNGAHESVGGQRTAASRLPLAPIAAACGYSRVTAVGSREALRATLHKALMSQGSQFIEVKCRIGHRDNLGRPTTSPSQNRTCFMRFLSQPAHSS